MTSDPQQATPGPGESGASASANQSVPGPADIASPAPCAKTAEKEEVRAYFESTGFDRWNRIYSDSDDVNKVQRNIRLGHQKTVDAVLAWLEEQGDLASRSLCDAGCGVGSLSLPLARLGAGSVLATDLSAAMVAEAQRRAVEEGLASDRLRFAVSDLESLSGTFDTVICLDVFIHYPQAAAEDMVRHLASLAERQLIVSFAPYTPLLAVLKGIGQLFPGPSKTTRAYQLKEAGIVEAAASAGFKPVHRSLNQAPFYFSQLVAFQRSQDQPPTR
jgi:magnesium-protoporphyrin O-methyltransferase